MASVSYKTGIIEVAADAYAFIQANGATREIRRGFDAGLSEEETAKQVSLGKFTSFMGQDRVRLITHMAYLAYRGELQ